jgi:hypothetical protein
MQKLREASGYNIVNAETEIEKFFGAVENPNDPCGINKLTIQNNVISIKPENMGSDNDYDPGF